MQRPHLRPQGRLIPHRRRHTAQEGRHFRPGLREPENVIDKQEHVLIFFIAEIFGNGQSRQADAKARARRLIHLAIHQGPLWIWRNPGDQ